MPTQTPPHQPIAAVAVVSISVVADLLRPIWVDAVLAHAIAALGEITRGTAAISCRSVVAGFSAVERAVAASSLQGTFATRNPAVVVGLGYT